MKAISVRPPWAWLIIYGGKDIENRTRRTHYRGEILIHASKLFTKTDYDEAQFYAKKLGVALPPPDELPRGGIIGMCELTGCVRESDSPWFFGPFGFVMQNPRPLPYLKFKGALNLFRVPDSLLGAT